jgi:hypothetical protein
MVPPDPAAHETNQRLQLGSIGWDLLIGTGLEQTPHPAREFIAAVAAVEKG